MTVKELERIMIEKGIAVRAIPETVRSVCEVRHAAQYPDGKIEYIPRYKREMLVVITPMKRAGKFIAVAKQGSGELTRFSPPFYDSLEEAVMAAAGSDD